MEKVRTMMCAIAVGLISCTADKPPGDSSGTGGAPAVGSGGAFTVVDTSGGGRKTEDTATGGSNGSQKIGLSVCRLEGMETRADPSRGTLIDDFDDGDTDHRGNGTLGFWIGNDDGTPGTQEPRSPGPSNAYAPLPDDAPSPGGVGETGSAMHVVGSGYTSWGSVIGLLLSASGQSLDQQCAFDASEYDGLSFWLKGSIRSLSDNSPDPLSVQVLESDIVPLAYGGECDPTRGACWDGHETSVRPTDCWRRHSVKFDQLAPNGWGIPPGELDLDELSAITFVVAHDMAYDYWLDELHFFRGDPPPEESRCDGTGGMGGLGGADAGQ